MSIPYDIRFEYGGRPLEVQVEPTSRIDPNSVTVDGITYSVKGTEEGINLVQRCLKEIRTSSEIVLKERLISKGALNVNVVLRPDKISHPEPTLRDQILTSQILPIEYIDSAPPSYPGSTQELINTIQDTVHKTIDSLDYHGLKPFTKMMKQINSGLTFRQIRIASQNEDYGSTCVGMSEALLKALKEKHQIDSGRLAAQRVATSTSPFEHAAVIIQCRDGYVLLDPRSDPKERIIQVGFNETFVHSEDITLKGAAENSPIPIIMKNPVEDYEFCTNIANAADLVIKHYIMGSATEGFPISSYDSTGKAQKFIWINPTQSTLLFKDATTTDPKKRTQNFTYQEALKEGFSAKLREFMKDDFHIPFEKLNKKIRKFISQEERVKRVFQEKAIPSPASFSSDSEQKPLADSAKGFMK
jgi:hypothetical protein